MSVRERMMSFWSKNFVEIIRPLGASPAFMGEDEDEVEGDQARGFNWSAAPVIGREMVAIEAEPPLEPSIQMAILETPEVPEPLPQFVGVQLPIIESTVVVPHVLPAIVATPAEPTVPPVSPVMPLVMSHPEAVGMGRNFSLSVNLNGVVAANGAVDFDVLFKNASLPDAPISAEQGAWILNMLPMDLPLRVRRISARSSLEAISKFDTAAATASVSHIVSDAALKMLYVSKLAKELAIQGTALRSRAEADIAELEAEIQVRRSALVETEHNFAIAQDSCRTRTSKFNDVIQFFDHADFAQDGEASAMIELESSDDRDMPLRMVGGAFK